MGVTLDDLETFAKMKPIGTTPERRVLVVEDDWLIALALEDMLQEAGYDVVGPVGDLAAAMHLSQVGAFDAAILDYWLHEVTVQPLADALTARRVPFALTTGFGIDVIPKDHGAACVVAKPYTQQDVQHVLARMWASNNETGSGAAMSPA